MLRLAPTTTKIETAIRFARVIDRYEECSESERYEAVQCAQADGVSTFDSLRTHILLGVANGSAPLVSQWLNEIQFGNFSDNCELFTVTQIWIANGEIEKGLDGLQLLRNHIIQHDEVKSVRHLLPLINQTIDTVARL